MVRLRVPLIVKNNLVLQYDAKENVMRDMNEYIIFNIFKYITPNELYLFKRNRETMIVAGQSGTRVTLLYL